MGELRRLGVFSGVLGALEAVLLVCEVSCGDSGWVWQRLKGYVGKPFLGDLEASWSRLGVF